MRICLKKQHQLQVTNGGRPTAHTYQIEACKNLHNKQLLTTWSTVHIFITFSRK